MSLAALAPAGAAPMPRRLLDAFIPVLACVRQFIAAPQGDAASLSAQLAPLLAAAQRQALEQGHGADDMRQALFAVVAWIDEALLTSGWPDADAWRRHLLQRQHFGISNAGVAFFEHLNQVDAGNAAVEEVYLMCLALGFQGRFGHGGQPAEREVIRQALLGRVLARAPQEVAGTADALLFPEAYATAPTDERRRWRWLPSRHVLAVALGGLLAVAAVYLLSHAVLASRVGTLLPLIR